MKTAIALIVAVHLGVAASAVWLDRTGFGAGPVIWLLLGALLLSWIAIAAGPLRVLCGRTAWPHWAMKIGLFTGGVIGVCLLFEIGLAVEDTLTKPSQQSSGGSRSMPAEWLRRDVEVAGATDAHYWHGVLHVFNADGMRRTEPFPAKREDYYRVMVVGDSLTYGYGVESDEAYPASLSESLAREYRIEILNLGVCGASSEDIRDTVERYSSLLQPDLVVYGICQNDFLPGTFAKYSRRRAYSLPFPKVFKGFMIEHTRVGRLVDDRYDNLLMRLGLRRDFLDDILIDFRAYKTRFARDLVAINESVIKHGLPPVVTMVLDQFPKLEGRGKQVTSIAEQAARNAGMDLVESEDYYRRFDGQALGVSRREGHPSREAHRIFAEYLRSAILKNPDLAAYRRRNRPASRPTGSVSTVNNAMRDLADILGTKSVQASANPVSRAEARLP
jgi:lysophospholipase L1-like esterase